MPKPSSIRIGTLIQQEFFSYSPVRQKGYEKGDILLGVIIDIKGDFFRVIFREYKSDYFPTWLIDCDSESAIEEGFAYTFKIKYY
tara:strand:+ start:503 stop:757 length:255 start_codon:yes stop_codon:yes gene_type:complete